MHEFETRVITQGAQVPFIWWYRIVAAEQPRKGWKNVAEPLYGQDFAEVWLAPEK